MKPTIDEQIEAVEGVLYGPLNGDGSRCPSSAPDPALEAALSTLRWVKLKTKPALGSVMEAFPGAKVVSQDGEE